MIKVDLHTHSTASPDGGISLTAYKSFLESGKLDCVAITDHNRIDFALEAQKRLGNKIIVGEEIMTKSGEIIGLFLKEVVPAGLNMEEAVKKIKRQGGLVYIPHPFETIRKGASEDDLLKIIKDIDIIETINGRAFADNQANRAHEFAGKHKIPGFASSDSHGKSGWGRTYTMLNKIPNKNNLMQQLSEAELVYAKPTLPAILYPKYNRIRQVLS